MAYSLTDATTFYASPTRLDVNGGTANYGRSLREFPVTRACQMGGRSAGSYVYSGFDPPEDSENVSSGYPVTGEAVIAGYYVGTPSGTATVTAPMNYASNWCYLVLNQDASGRVQKLQVRVEDADRQVKAAATPAFSSEFALPLWRVNVSGGSVTSSVDLRRTGLWYCGKVSWSGSAYSITYRGSANWHMYDMGSEDLRIHFERAFYNTPFLVSTVTDGAVSIGSAFDYLHWDHSTSSGSIIFQVAD